ncbi:2-C-methyl-D-erythritol 4-phosphate cytidylyltransferase [Paenibacillus sacheonensis]|uniref:2-C-methyl-D-erythritol 4-phosphate cytidylyltransferase n=1 Tax=Paenibacillus sacheonensis TaxID=742054 RepID=A0A7X4YX69_9BACL|nr:2-C-methyl-D-erythritol 4-phosphate cytidylyltransferase [Paenibacillus sacheonensis]MBM7569430.1 2-C-methyl-D-erythritol 4-phosphate cytidylyltransferase [Paenibacillus sacheonensis]NBC73239.1 2-C-methyl-D-erythritol 4-phosphate cytidylyltransferase [Paenibacillus sacheonensis]
MADQEATWGVVIVAAGRGTRMGTVESKQYLLLRDKPILVHTLQTFEAMSEIAAMCLVVGPQDVERCEALVSDYGLHKVKSVTAGGSERQHSVQQGLRALDGVADWVMVHDGVRPFVTHKAVRACMAKAMETGAAVLAVPVKDTIKQVNDNGIITATPERRSLWAIQTPQAFRRSLLVQGLEKAAADRFVGTDDAMAVERLGVAVSVAEGDYTNIKITTPDDLPYAEFLLATRERERGTDV